MAPASKIAALLQLIRFDRPIGTLLLLWPTLWALWLAAQGVPDARLLAIFIAGTFLMRAAGCVINDLADRDIDGAVERTRQRPFARGAVTPREALLLAAGLALLALLIALPLNRLALLLTLPALFLAVTYPFTKRFFPIPQAYLGLAFGFGIPMAFAVVNGGPLGTVFSAQAWAALSLPGLWAAVPPLAWLLLLGNLFWVLAYDTEYAMVDRDDDLKIGMKTSAITLGRFDVAAIMLFYAIYLSIWALALAHKALGAMFYIAIAVAAAQAAWHWHLIRDRTRDGCFKAFRLNHWVGVAVFVGVALSVGKG